MKKYLVLSSIIVATTFANAQNCFWAKSAGAANNEEGKSITTDVNGNVYVIGAFGGSSITFGSTTLTNSTGTDAYFIVKYNISGIVQWARGANGIAAGLGITTDNIGNVYVTGNFDGASTTFGGTTLNNLGAGDAFVLKYDSLGNTLWAKSFGGSSGWETGDDITADAGGYLYLTGRFNSSSITIGTTTLNNSFTSGPDLFVAKYDTAGNAIWAKSAGGNREDIGYGITVDGSGNSYVTGTFQSDSIKFGSVTLHNTAPGGYDMFVTKYGSTGNVAWAKGIEGLWGNVVAYDIKIDAANNLYAAGEFAGASVTFGNDSLINSSSGTSDVFIAKYDSSGNALWAKSGGGNNYDYSRSLTVDGIGNVYSIGYSSSTSIIFGSDTLNAGPGWVDIFITKYDTSGALQWAQRVGDSINDIGHDIAAGLGDNVYFTGTFFSKSLSFASTTLTNAGGYDMFVADIFSFSSGISSSTNVSCYGGNDGTAFTTASGGNMPYTYLWNTTPTQTTTTVTNLPAGAFTVIITEGFGCAQTHTVTITQPSQDSTPICLVTVDSLSQYNIIVWDKTSFTDIDSFIVYREITTNNYQPIARIPFDSLSQFIDTVRTKYFPNTGNPNAGTYRYKLQGHYNCGNYTAMSSYHNTIYFINNSGTFSWPQLYTIEGSPNPVSAYVLMRDDFNTGNWHAVNSVAGTQLTVTDPAYTAWQATAIWRVQTSWSISCTPTMRISTGLTSTTSSSKSNTTNNPNSVHETIQNNLITISPNPSSGFFTINSTLKRGTIEIYNVLGEKVFYSIIHPSSHSVIDISNQPKGIYLVRVITDGKTYSQKIVIQ